MVFLQTDAHRQNLPQYAGSRCCDLPAHSDDTRELIVAALAMTRRAYRGGYEYKKAGALLSNLVRRDAVQASLFDRLDRCRSADVMAVVDAVKPLGFC